MKTPMAGFKARIAQGMPYLSYASFTLAAVGGFLLPGTAVGQQISQTLKTIPVDWAVPVAFSAMVVGVLLDWVRDLIPDRVAIYSIAFAPTLATAINGELARHVVDFAGWIAGWSVDWLSRWSGIPTSSGIAVL